MMKEGEGGEGGKWGKELLGAHCQCDQHLQLGPSTLLEGQGWLVPTRVTHVSAEEGRTGA